LHFFLHLRVLTGVPGAVSLTIATVAYPGAEASGMPMSAETASKAAAIMTTMRDRMGTREMTLIRGMALFSRY
jgi:hypothetical protein